MENKNVIKLIKELDNLSQTRYVSLIFNTIFRTPNQEFFKMVKQCSDNIYEIVEDSNGDIELFGYKLKNGKVVNEKLFDILIMNIVHWFLQL